MTFSDFSLGKKMSMMLAVPILGFLWFGLSLVIQNSATTNEMGKLTELTQLSTVYSDLVHELQKERGSTAGFLGSKGKKFSNKLKVQRGLTDDKAQTRVNYWRENAHNDKAIISLNHLINQHLAELESIRQQVDSQTIKITTAINYYTKLNAKLLSISTLTSQVSTNSNITKEIIAYYNFLQGKERAGIERAVLSSTFANNAFSTGMLEKFIILTSEQNTYFTSFEAFSTIENVNYFKQKLNTPEVNEVIKMRKIALEKSSTGQFDIDSLYWFEQSTSRIGQLKKIENSLAKTLLANTTEVKSQAEYSLMQSIIQIIVVIIIVVLITHLISKDLQMRVKELKTVMASVRDDNDLTHLAEHKGDSELGVIASSLNDTLDTFSGAIKEISSSSITLAAAAEETAQTCEHNSESMQEQQGEIALVATAIEELSATVREVATNTQLTADSAKQADEQAKEGLEVVKISYRSIESLANEITDIAARITSLHESSKNITNVVDVIKSVAEQTNLLALNAAIEAARAGEQGRGFAVVADEVRTLAQRTQDSTSEIENFINTLQSDANSAFSVIESSQQKASAAVENSKHVEDSLHDITQSINHIFSMSEQVATAVEEQSLVTQDVAQNVVNIENKSMESTTAATQIAATAKEQAILSSTLQDIAVTFKT
jgi:methyl-accepting chemotaxis protein